MASAAEFLDAPETSAAPPTAASFLDTPQSGPSAADFLDATPERKKPDALDLFNYHVATNGIGAIQGLFRGLQAIASDDQKKQVLQDTIDGLQKYRSETLPNYYGVKPDDLKSTTSKVAGAAATVSDIAAGPAAMIAKMTGQTYGDTYAAAAQQAQQAGITDPDAIDAAARTAGGHAVLKMAPVLAAYAVGGQVAAKGAEFLLPETAGAAARFAVGTGASTAANLAVSAGTRAAEGQPAAGDLQQNLTDIFFGAAGGIHAASAAPEARPPGDVGLEQVQVPTTNVPLDPGAAGAAAEGIPDARTEAAPVQATPQPFRQDEQIPFMSRSRWEDALTAAGYDDAAMDKMSADEAWNAVNQLQQARAANANVPLDPAARGAEETPPAAARPVTDADLAEAEYRQELLAQSREAQASEGKELLEAVIDAGGLPAKSSPARASYSGELDRLDEAVRRNGTRQERIPANQLFRANAPGLDEMAVHLRDQGFDIQTPNDLLNAVGERLRTGKEHFGTPARESLAAATLDNNGTKSLSENRDVDTKWVVSQDAAAHSDIARLRAAIDRYKVLRGQPEQAPARLSPVDRAAHYPGHPDVAKAEALAKATGTTLRWYRDLSGEGFGGVSVRNLPGRIFVNIEGHNPFHEVAGHEITHRMQEEAPDLYREYHDAVLSLSTDFLPFDARSAERGYHPSQWDDERVANFTQESLRNPKRFAEALGRNPTLLERVRGFIADMMERFKRALGVANDMPRARDAIADLTKADAAMKKAFDAYRARSPRSAPPADPVRNGYRLPILDQEMPLQADFEEAANDKEKMREHIATVQRMTEASPDVKERVESWYTPVTLKEVQDRANATIDKIGLGKAQDLFLRSRAADADIMALGHNVAIRLDQLQRFDEAATVRDAMAARLTSPAQALWFISTIGKTSPEGLIRTAQKIVTDQVAADPEKVRLLDEINRLKQQLAALPPGQTRDAATKIVIQNLARVDKPGQRLSSSQLETLLTKHGAGELGPEDLATALAKHLKIPRLTPDNIIKIKQAQKAWNDATDPIVKLRRGAEMMDSVYGLVPRNFWDKVRATATISMILHGRLPIRIGASNLLNMAGQTAVDAVNSVTLDPLLSILTGDRTVTGPNLKARLTGLAAPITAFRAGSADAAARGLGTVQSFQEGARTMLDMATMTTRGILDVGDMGGRPLHVFSSRFGKLAEDTVTLLHNVVPYAFWSSAYKASLARQMGIAGVDVPTAAHLTNARLDANKAIFQNNTAAEAMMKGIRKVLDMPTAAVTGGKYGVGTATIPFAKVPGAILTEGATWTPLGFVRAGWEAFRPLFTNDGGFRQKDFADAFTKAAIGTGSLVATGYWLSKLGVISGAPDENKEVDAMRKSTGFGSYRVNFSELKRRFMTGNFTSRAPNYIGENGDVTFSYNWMEPIAFPLAMGADIAHSQDKREIDLKRGKITSNAVVSAANAGLQTLTTHPMMQGVNRFVQQMSESGLGIAAAGALANVPGNFIPSLVRQTSQYIDNTVRENRGGTMVDQQASRIATEIPWLSQRYPARYDVFGEAVQRYNYGANSLVNIFFNPAQPNKLRLNPNVNELMNLASATGETRGLPNQVTRNITINGKQVQLDNQQLATYQRYVGQLSSAGITRLMASPQFAAEPMQTRQAAMVQVLDAVHTAAKIDLFGQKNYSVGNRGQVRIASPYAFQQMNLGRQAGLTLPSAAGANQ